MFINQYNENVAIHYAAYRPPIHEIVLARTFSNKDHFNRGLDIGSGVGYSTIALSNYCDCVFGVEPSEDMRERAFRNNKVRYLSGAGESIPLDDGTIDIVTLAGTICYINKDSLVFELQRVCKSRAHLIVYDFEVFLKPFVDALQISDCDLDIHYDHKMNLSEFSQLSEIDVYDFKHELTVSSDQLAHILLSSDRRIEKLAAKFGHYDPHAELSAFFRTNNTSLTIAVNIYISNYLVNVK